MQPDLAGTIPAILIGIALLLLVPKRSWRSLPRRLGETWSGERSYLFGPPARQGVLESDFLERWLQLTRREASRIFELGIPLYAAATVAELHGRAESGAAEAAWSASPQAIVLEHLRGHLSEEQMAARMREQGFPAPRAKLWWTPPRQLTMPPMQWRIDWERQLMAGDQAEAAKEAEHASPPALSPDLLQIRALGVVQLKAGDEDFAPVLLHRPVQCFFWLHLLAREARRPGDRITRAALADELFPGLDPEQQRDRFRKRLNEVQSSLPAPLARRVKTEGEYIWLDLADCNFDVRWVLQLASDAAAAGELLPDPLLQEIERALPLAAEEFLPGWEEIERRVTGARGVAGEVVGEVRADLARAHVTLLLAMAGCYQALQQPNRGVPYLEEALRCHPEDESIAHKLVVAYEKSGLVKKALKLRQEYRFTEAS